MQYMYHIFMIHQIFDDFKMQCLTDWTDITLPGKIILLVMMIMISYLCLRPDRRNRKDDR